MILTYWSGVLRRIRGGAELTDSTPFEQALAARHAEQFEDKLVIARRVAEELPQDGVVVLDSGSLTCFALKRCRRIAASPW